MTLPESAAAGDRLATLRDLRDVLAKSIVEPQPGPAIAALSRQLTDVLSQIEAAEKAVPEQKGTALDELQKRRAARGAGASRQA